MFHITGQTAGPNGFDIFFNFNFSMLMLMLMLMLTLYTDNHILKSFVAAQQCIVCKMCEYILTPCIYINKDI